MSEPRALPANDPPMVPVCPVCGTTRWVSAETGMMGTLVVIDVHGDTLVSGRDERYVDDHIELDYACGNGHTLLSMRLDDDDDSPSDEEMNELEELLQDVFWKTAELNITPKESDWQAFWRALGR